MFNLPPFGDGIRAGWEYKIRKLTKRNRSYGTRFSVAIAICQDESCKTNCLSKLIRLVYKLNDLLLFDRNYNDADCFTLMGGER